MDASFAEPLVFVGTAPFSQEIPFRTTSFSGLTVPLPKNVMLVTRKPLYDNPERTTFLVRLGHQYGLGEDPDLSLPVQVDLSVLFPGQIISGFSETTLSGNRAVEDWRKERLDWSGSARGGRSGDAIGSFGNQTTVVTLTALDIRTFVVTLVGGSDFEKQSFQS
jgi:hypothetical protein